MEDVYELLVTIDEPDALTGELRRSSAPTNAAAVLEHSRSDVTTTVPVPPPSRARRGVLSRSLNRGAASTLTETGV